MIVEIEKLTKIYESKLRVVAVDGIDLELKQGEIFGLLGPNGAGKTTTISIATTRTLPTSGTVRIAGIDVVQHPAHARRLIGVVPQFNTLDRSLTVYENLYFHCRYFGFSHAQAKARSLELLDQFLLTERKHVYPRNSPAAWRSECRLPAPSPTGPRCCSLTSPPPVSIRRAAWPCGPPSRTAQGGHHRSADHPLHGRGRPLSDRLAIIDYGRVLALGPPADSSEVTARTPSLT